MLMKAVQAEYRQWITDYERVVSELHNLNSVEVQDSKYLHDALNDELADKGFDKNQINLIIFNPDKMDKETARKFLAYAYNLYNEYTDIEDLKKLINDDAESNLDDLTDEDIEKIIEYSYTLS